MGKMLRKHLAIIKQDGLFGLFSVYMRTLAWWCHRFLSLEKSSYKEVQVNDYRMYIDFKDCGISKALYLYGSREKDQMYIVKKHIRRNTKILDIGANIGYYVIMEALAAGPAIRVIAYEPSADNWRLLQKNIILNGLADRVEAHNAAVSNTSGVSRFYLSKKSNLHTLNPESYKNTGSPMQKNASVEVETVDIRDIIERHKDITFIRMDIEGHEVEVLGGIARAVKEFGGYPDILFETHFPKYDSTRHNIEEKLETLFELGYTPEILTSNDERVSSLRKKGYHPRKVAYTDRVSRGIYDDVTREDALDLIARKGGVRAVFLRKK